MTVRRFFDGDIATSGVHFLRDVDDIRQTITTRMMLWRGEYFRDITDGTPWAERILGKGVSLQSREAAIKLRITQTPGVQEIVSFEANFDLAQRKYTADVSVITDTGELVSANVGGAV